MELTLEKIKEVIEPIKDEPIADSLIRLCDIWYAVEKKAGKTEQESLEITLDKLADKFMKTF